MSEKYFIKVVEAGLVKYLFNTRVLLSDQALAKPFSSELLAKRYFKKTNFTELPHTIFLQKNTEVSVERPSLGSIVE